MNTKLIDKKLSSRQQAVAVNGGVVLPITIIYKLKLSFFVETIVVKSPPNSNRWTLPPILT